MKKQTKHYDIFSSQRNQRIQNMGLYDLKKKKIKKTEMPWTPQFASTSVNK